MHDFGNKELRYSAAKKEYVILGVTGPNEYENNVNNNWYTNYIAQWCINYALENIEKVKSDFITLIIFELLKKQTLNFRRIRKMARSLQKTCIIHIQKHKVYLQQDGFLDKELITVANLAKDHRPNQSKMVLGSNFTITIY